MMTSVFLLFILSQLIVVFALPAMADDAEKSFAPFRKQGIVVSQEADMAPMSFRGHNGKPKGYIIDLWLKWSAETGIPVRFHLVDWADTLTAVRDGKADVHGGLFFTEERDEYLDYSSAFFPSKGGLFIKKGSGVQSVDDLKGRPVGVIEKSFFENFVRRNYPHVNMVPIRTAAELVTAADTGVVDAFIADYPTLMFQIGTMGKANEFTLVEYLSHQEFRAAVAQGNANLLTMVEEGLKLIDQDERDTLLNRWIVGDQDQTGSWLLPVGIVSLAALSLAILLPFVWGRRNVNQPE